VTTVVKGQRTGYLQHHGPMSTPFPVSAHGDQVGAEAAQKHLLLLHAHVEVHTHSVAIITLLDSLSF
jgi:hypothetical protein